MQVSTQEGKYFQGSLMDFKKTWCEIGSIFSTFCLNHDLNESQGAKQQAFVKFHFFPFMK